VLDRLGAAAAARAGAGGTAAVAL